MEPMNVLIIEKKSFTDVVYLRILKCATFGLCRGTLNPMTVSLLPDRDGRKIETEKNAHRRKRQFDHGGMQERFSHRPSVSGYPEKLEKPKKESTLLSPEKGLP